MAVIKFGGFAPNDVFNTIGGFKFGGMVWYRHTYVHAEKKFNLVIERHTTKPPNFPAIRYALESSSFIMDLHVLLLPNRLLIHETILTS